MVKASFRCLVRGEPLVVESLLCIPVILPACDECPARCQLAIVILESKIKVYAVGRYPGSRVPPLFE